MTGYYEAVMPYINEIKNWFENTYGIILHNRQAIEFSIYSASTLIKEVEHWMYKNHLTFLKIKYVTINANAEMKLCNIKNKYFKDKSLILIITLLIYQRALTLPKVIIRKPFTYRMENNTADEYRYEPRYNDILQNEKYKSAANDI